MGKDGQEKFRAIVNDLTNYIQNQYMMGTESLSASEMKEIGGKIETLMEKVSKGKSFSADFCTLEKVCQELGDCNRCGLCTSRKNIVFGEGSSDASLLFVGEAPGREEDLVGKPFVGEAGKLLTRIIEAIDLSRKDVYITNVLKCRPPRNRDPQPEEIKTCLPFLKKQLRIIRPRIICALGRFAAQTLLETNEKISSLRGNIYEFQNCKVVPTFHPASLLRNPQWKRPVWEDMQLIQKLLEGKN